MNGQHHFKAILCWAFEQQRWILRADMPQRCTGRHRIGTTGGYVKFSFYAKGFGIRHEVAKLELQWLLVLARRCVLHHSCGSVTCVFS